MARTKMKRPHELGPLDPQNLPPGYYVDDIGCIRCKKTDIFVEGGETVPANITKRTIKDRVAKRHKSDTLVEKLKTKFKEGDILINQLYSIVKYDYAKDLFKSGKKDENGEDILTRPQSPRVKEADRISAIKIVLGYMYGQPSRQITVDKNVDIKIDAKMHHVAELLSQNRDKLKVIEGGKTEDIIDIKPEPDKIEEKDNVNKIINDELEKDSYIFVDDSNIINKKDSK